MFCKWEIACSGANIDVECNNTNLEVIIINVTVMTRFDFQFGFTDFLSIFWPVVFECDCIIHTKCPILMCLLRTLPMLFVSIRPDPTEFLCYFSFLSSLLLLLLYVICLEIVETGLHTILIVTCFL
jgi:hypothetical protein